MGGAELPVANTLVAWNVSVNYALIYAMGKICLYWWVHRQVCDSLPLLKGQKSDEHGL